MARDVVVRIVCDLCGNGNEGTESIQFAGGSRSTYEMDLCTDHSREVHDTIERWRDVARPVRPGSTLAGQQGGTRVGRSASDRQRIQDIRRWARAHGFADLSERGRLPGAAIAAYESATEEALKARGGRSRGV